MKMNKHAAIASSLVALCSLTSPAADAAPADEPRGFWKETVALPTGIEMQYVEAGNPESNEVIVFLHGYTDSSRSFLPTIEALLALDSDLHVYAPDLRGHGGASMPAGSACPDDPRSCFEMADFADDVFAFMDAESIESAHLVGHSMGTLIAQQMALTHPHRVGSLVLIGAAARVTGNPVFEEFLLEGMLQGNGADGGGLWRAALEAEPDFGAWPRDAWALTPRDADPEAESWIAENWVRTPRRIPPSSDGSSRRRPASGSAPGWAPPRPLLEVNNTAALANLRVDSLVLWATQDVVFPAGDQQELRAALDAAAVACRSGYIWKQYGKQSPPAEGQTDLGHNTQWGAPAQVAADIHAYIATGKPTPDLYFADPADPTLIRLEAVAARIIEVPAASGC